MPKLENCPFCNGEARLHDDYMVGIPKLSRDGSEEAYVFCESCEARGPVNFTGDAAVQDWNNRRFIVNTPPVVAPQRITIPMGGVLFEGYVHRDFLKFEEEENED